MLQGVLMLWSIYVSRKEPLVIDCIGLLIILII
uniref:Uncharacterized protein n=1 Tax=Anguilla anguilla TaxID=7936 RepID=A0A0E9SP50_ANGAN